MSRSELLSDAQRVTSLTAPARPGISPLSLHDALPISGSATPTAASATAATTPAAPLGVLCTLRPIAEVRALAVVPTSDRKSTRLNSSHQIISYAGFCLKKKGWRLQRVTSCFREWTEVG